MYLCVNIFLGSNQLITNYVCQLSSFVLGIAGYWMQNCTYVNRCESLVGRAEGGGGPNSPCVYGGGIVCCKLISTQMHNRIISLHNGTFEYSTMLMLSLLDHTSMCLPLCPPTCVSITICTYNMHICDVLYRTWATKSWFDCNYGVNLLLFYNFCLKK